MCSRSRHKTPDMSCTCHPGVWRNTREIVIHAEMSDSDHLQIAAEQNASGVSVTGRVTQHSWLDWLNYSSMHVRFTIAVPRDYPMELKTSGGSLDVRSLSASVKGKTAGGSITIRDVTGQIDAHTSGGNIDAERINGPTQLGTSGGSIDINDARGDLDVHTSGGSVRAEVRINRGVDLSTSGGSITLLLSEDAGASIDAKTSGGRVESELPLSNTELAERSHLRGAINGGGEPVVLRTSGGSIDVEPLRGSTLVQRGTKGQR